MSFFCKDYYGRTFCIKKSRAKQYCLAFLVSQKIPSTDITRCRGSINNFAYTLVVARLYTNPSVPQFKGAYPVEVIHNHGVVYILAVVSRSYFYRHSFFDVRSSYELLPIYPLVLGAMFSISLATLQLTS